jgi:hypothetical protein
MWLCLDSEILYRFDAEIDPVAFFERLPLLVRPCDTLVLGCYDARADIRSFLKAEALPPSEHYFRPLDTFEINRNEYPNGAAFHLRADQRILQQLVRFAGGVDRHIDLCDHVAAYSSEHPILIYHGTFWEPLFVSSRVPRRQVEEFSRSIRVPFEEIDFYQTYL